MLQHRMFPPTFSEDLENSGLVSSFRGKQPLISSVCDPDPPPPPDSWGSVLIDGD